MDDFASAGMQRLLQRGLVARGLAPRLSEPAGAHVPRAHKQALVAAIVLAGGPALLLELARQVQHLDGEPLHRALIGAADPHAFLSRWQRVERYVHASHRVAELGHAAGELRLAHVAARDGIAAPHPFETVAVLGVWIGALEAIGTTGLRVRIDGAQVHPWPAHPAPALRALARTDSPLVWQLRWSACTGAPAPSPDARLDAALGAVIPWAEPAAGVARWLARDPAATPRLEAACAALGLSRRTLQRRLADCGTGFAEIVAEVRVRLAAAWLTQTGHGLAEIGYLCGFSDQPHFTREFTRRAGMPPARYRGAARASAPWATGT